MQRDDWRGPIYDVMRHLHREMDRAVSLSEASYQAAFSPYYLHRRFLQATGETVVQMGRRLRLEKAAHLLESTQKSISEIALDCGFESLEVFGRAFAGAFTRTPSAFRKAPLRSYYLPTGSGIHFRPGCPDCSDVPLPFGDSTMSINIVKLPPMRVLSIRGMGDYGGMVEVWPRFLSYVTEQQVPFQKGWFFTLFHDHNEAVPVEQKRYDISCAVPESFTVADEGVFVQDFAGGEYVIYTFRGDNEGIGPAWDRFRSTWFQENGYRLRQGLPSVEWYRSDPREVPIEHLLTDLCDPIEPAPAGFRVEKTWPAE